MDGARFEFACQAVLALMDRLGPHDEIGVFGFNDLAFNIQTWTHDRAAVEQALRRVKPDSYTALYSAVSAGLDALASARHRRRALLVISDGDDRLMGDKARPGDFSDAQRRAMPVIDRIARNEALVYAIGIDAPSPYRVDPVALRKLTDPTGGLTEIVRSDAAVVAAVERIGDELRQQYLIGFVPAHRGDGKFHHVHVSVRGCAKCRVRTRVGYFADPT